MSTSIRCRAVRMLAVAMTMLCTAALPLVAQATGTIRGTVVETGTRRPLVGATVGIPGTVRTAVTNAAGEYTLAEVPAGRVQLRATMLGFEPAVASVNVAAGQTARGDFALAATATALDAIVVTGTAGAVSKRTVGNAITKLDVEDVTAKTTVSNVVEVLQARTPGVQILPNAGTPGAAPDIRIRGAGSFITNQPVIFIDGVRYNTESLGSFIPSGAGPTNFTGQETSALNLVSPEDIESIEVIKGPAAATLYGAEAAGGVIQIITKRGARGQQRTQWNVKYTRGQSELALDVPANYTTCDAAKIANPTTWPGCEGRQSGEILTSNPLRDDPLSLREGDLQRVNLSVRGGGERYSYYLSGDLDEEEGIFHNSFNNRQSIRANFSLNPTEKFDFQVSTGYIRNHLRLALGDESAQGLLLSAVRGRPGFTRPRPEQLGWYSVSAAMANEYNNQTRSDRVTISTTGNYRPFDWFRNRLTLGLDLTNSLAELLAEPGSTDADYYGDPAGYSAQRIPRNRVFTIDYAGNVNVGITQDLESTTSFGTQIIGRRYESLYGQGTGLGAPDVTLIQSAQRQTSSNTFSENNTVGYYLQEQIGWRNRLFLTGALRADDHSAFGTEFDLIVYPKASVAWVLSEEPMLTGFFDAARMDNFKLRAAYGQAGRAPPAYSATQTFTIDKVSLGNTTGSAVRTLAFGNPNLEPERGEEYEVGFDAGFFGGRAGAEFTYYNKHTDNLLQARAIAGSTGFAGGITGLAGTVYENLGEIENSGFELGIYGTPIQTRPFAWESRITASANRNELISFGDSTRLQTVVNSHNYNAGLVRHRVGYPLGAYWGALPLRNEDGTPKLRPGTENTTRVVLVDTVSYIGPSVPTREIGFSNTFTLFGNLQFYSLFDYKGGHYLFNYKEYERCRVYANCERVNNPALANDPERPVWVQNPASWVEKADFVKLRDLSLTYSVPSTWTRRFGSQAASLTLAGHNLALWTDYSGIDPEVNTFGDRGGGFVRTDAFAAPMNRRVSMSVNFSF